MTVPFECTVEDIRWAGLACADDDPCPIYLELSAVDSVRGRIFLAGDIHSDTVTLYSLLLSSDDDGQTWREGAPRIRGAGLDRIQFLDNLGWIAGQTQFPISQDPFFMVTTDGGVTWAQRPVFSDDHFGSIQQFSLESKTGGNVVLDLGADNEGGRFTRYASGDGGETWSLKEVSRKPIQLKPASTAAARWRIRAEAASRAFRVERRQGDRWVGVASFSVKLPSCKPQ